jgi:ribosomal protein L35AE/L33A
MDITEVKIGDMVTFKNKQGKMVKGKVIHRHSGKDAAHLAGHVNVEKMGGESYPFTVHASKIKPAIKEETEMDDIKEVVDDLIDNIDAGNNIEAEQIFQELLQTKVAELLDIAKQEVAANMFNTEECTECDEANEQNVFTGYGKTPYKTKPRSPEHEARLDAHIKKANAENDAKSEKLRQKGLKFKRGVHEEVEEAVVVKPTSAVQSAIDAYKKKKAAATHDGKTNPPMPAVKKEEVNLEEGNPDNKMKKKAFVQKLGNKIYRQNLAAGKKTPSVAPDTAFQSREMQNKRLARKAMKEEVEITSEALKGNQHKIDANKNGKVDAHDFKLLRGRKTPKQVDELKSTTLRSYIKKAKADGKEKSKMSDDIRARAAHRGKKPSWTGKTIIANLAAAKTKRDGKIAMAKDKLKTEEAEQVDELSKNTLKSYLDKAPDSYRELKKTKGLTASKTMRRSTGVARAAIGILKKGMKEETVNELKQSTMTKAFAARSDPQGPESDSKKADKTLGHIKRKHGDAGVANAEKHATAKHFGRSSVDSKNQGNYTRPTDTRNISKRVTKAGKLNKTDSATLKKHYKYKLAKEEVTQDVEVTEASYAKKGNIFKKISKKASRKYGKDRAAKIAGAVIAKMRKKTGGKK